MNTTFLINKVLQGDEAEFGQMLMLAPLMNKVRTMVLPYFWTFERIISNSMDANDLRQGLTALGDVYSINGNWTFMLNKHCLVSMEAERMYQANEYTKYTMSVHASSRTHLETVTEKIRALFPSVRNQDLMCEVQWYYGSGNYDYESVYELLNDVIVPEAYPFIPNMQATIREYAQSNESVLLLIGEPGTGKSRLIRYIIRTMAEMQDTQHIKVYYTSNGLLLSGDSIYSDFRTSSASAFILEDADLHLSARTDGNDVMTKLLSTSDSFVSASTNKKIILTTNLSSLNGTDDALLRPGRCFGVIETRKFTRGEAQRFLEVAAPGKQVMLENELYTLAELYRLISPHAESVRQLSDSARYKLASKRGIGFAAV